MPPPRSAAPRLGRRVLLLFACLLAGAAIGFAGLYFTGSSSWFLAVPACIAAGWFAVADPTACLPPQQENPRFPPPRE